MADSPLNSQSKDRDDSGKGLTFYPMSPREKRIRDMVLADFALFAEAAIPKHKKFSDYLSHYYNEVKKKRKKGQANVPVPLASDTVDSIHADVMANTVNSDGLLIDTQPTEGTDEMQAEANKDLILHQAYVDGMSAAWSDLSKTTVMFGTSVAKVVYVERWGTFTDKEEIRDMFGAVVGYAKIESEKMVYRGPTLVPVDIFDFFPHPDLVEPEEPLPKIHRFIATPEMVEERSRQGLFKNTRYINWDHANLDEEEQTDSEPKKERRRLARGGGGHGATQKGIECYEWVGMYDIDNSGKRANSVCVVTEDGIVLRDEPLPYHDQDGPYICPRINRIPGEFWGIGAIEKQHPMIHGVNALNNTMLDALYQGVHPPRLVDERGIPNQSELVNRKGQIIHVRRKDGENMENYFKQLHPQSVAPDVWNAMGTYKDWAGEASGRTEFMRGQVPSESQTATAVDRTFRQASAKFKLLLREIEDTGLIPLCDKMQKINLQFMDQAEVVRVIGRKGIGWRKITPEDIAGQVHFVALGSSREVDKSTNIQQLMQLLQVVRGDPQLQQLTPMIFLALTDQFNLPHREMIQDRLQWMQQKLQYYEQLEMYTAQINAQRGLPPPTAAAPNAGGGMTNMPQVSNAQDLLSSINNRNAVQVGGQV